MEEVLGEEKNPSLSAVVHSLEGFSSQGLNEKVGPLWSMRERERENFTIIATCINSGHDEGLTQQRKSQCLSTHTDVNLTELIQQER